MSRYAENTAVSSEQSRAEIEKTLRRYGATGFMYGWQETQAVVVFDFNKKRVRFTLFMPDQNERRFTHTEHRNTPRTKEQAYKEWEQACRQRWRALALVIKAKLEAVETDITTFEEEFLAHIVVRDGRTVGETLIPSINELANGQMQVMKLLTS